MKNCSKCHKKNNENNIFCIFCGEKFTVILKSKEEDKEENKVTYADVVSSKYGIILALLSKVSKVTGNISHKEAQLLSQTIDTFMAQENFPKDSYIRDLFKKIIEQEKNIFDNIETICVNIYDDKFKLSTINKLLIMGYIDGKMEKKQENLIISIVHTLKIDFVVYKKMRDVFEPRTKQNNNLSKLEESCEILEISINDTPQTIKNNYRRLVKSYHTDFLVSKNLPSDMIAFAEEKLKKINNAYEIIKKYKGI